MADLLRKPSGSTGKVHDITPASAGWGYVGFGLYHLAAGEVAAEATGAREAILVLVQGRAQITAAGRDFGEMGARMSPFERTPPHCLYVPDRAEWRAVATTACVLAVCTAPGKEFGVQEELLPAIVGLLDQAHAVAFLRCLKAEIDTGKVRRIFAQMLSVGKGFIQVAGRELSKSLAANK